MLNKITLFLLCSNHNTTLVCTPCRTRKTQKEDHGRHCEQSVPLTALFRVGQRGIERRRGTLWNALVGFSVQRDSFSRGFADRRYSGTDCFWGCFFFLLMDTPTPSLALLPACLSPFHQFCWCSAQPTPHVRRRTDGAHETNQGWPSNTPQRTPLPPTLTFFFFFGLE